MDYQDYITVAAERKKGQHLGMVERGAIKALKQQGLGIRAIAREVGCAPSTITNELRRGTPVRKSTKGKAPGMPAAATPSCTTCLSRLRWFAPAHSTI